MRGKGVADLSLAEREQIRRLVAQRWGVREIAAELEASRGTIQRSVKTYNLGPWLNRRCNAPIPPTFAEAYPNHPYRELAKQFGISREMVAKWAHRLGLVRIRVPAVKKPPSKRSRLITSATAPRLPQPRGTISAVARDMSVVGQAVDHLRRYGAVYRCNARGGAVDKGGTHWRRGAAVLTDEEVIDRAKRLGFDPEGWRKLAA